MGTWDDNGLAPDDNNYTSRSGSGSGSGSSQSASDNDDNENDNSGNSVINKAPVLRNLGTGGYTNNFGSWGNGPFVPSQNNNPYMPNVPNVAGSQPPGGSFSQGIGTKNNDTFGNFPSVKRADSSNPVLRSKSEILDAGREFPGSVLNSGGGVIMQSKPNQGITPPRHKNDHTRVDKFIHNPLDDRRDWGHEEDEDNDEVQTYDGTGTRVFKFNDQDYDRPRYVHKDGSRNVFFCNNLANINKVIDILKRSPGLGIWDTDVLEKYGTWHDLDSYESFGKKYIDNYVAIYFGNLPVANLHNHILNGKPWITQGQLKPSAEVVKRIAKTGVHLKPMGMENHIDNPDSHEDKRGYPNLITADYRPLLYQPDPTNGKWTGSFIHIHPVGAGPGYDKKTNPNAKDRYYWTDASGLQQYMDGEPGPSGINNVFNKPGDDKVLQDIINVLQSQKNNDVDADRQVRSIVVDRRNIYLYKINTVFAVKKNFRFMTIKRLEPDTKY